MSFTPEQIAAMQAELARLKAENARLEARRNQARATAERRGGTDTAVCPLTLNEIADLVGSREARVLAEGN